MSSGFLVTFFFKKLQDKFYFIFSRIEKKYLTTDIKDRDREKEREIVFKMF